jgi:hypothetical protein
LCRRAKHLTFTLTAVQFLKIAFCAIEFLSVRSCAVYNISDLKVYAAFWAKYEGHAGTQAGIFNYFISDSHNHSHLWGCFSPSAITQLIIFEKLLCSLFFRISSACSFRNFVSFFSSRTIVTRRIVIILENQFHS